MSEPIDLERDRESWEKISASRSNESIGVLEILLFIQNKQKLHFKKKMHVLYDFKSGFLPAPIPWVESSGSEMEKRGEF